MTLDLIVGDSISVLNTHQDSVNAHGFNAFFGVLILNGHLGLVIGHHPRQYFLVHAFSQAFAQLVSEQMGEWHAFFRLVGGVTDHEALVTRAEVFFVLVSSDAVENFRALDVKVDHDSAIFVIHAFLDIIVSDFLDGLTDNLFITDLCFGVDFTKYHAHIVFHACFTCDQRFWILLKQGVQNRIGNIIG
jgi:aromatic ring-cleaving dioxygenase